MIPMIGAMTAPGTATALLAVGPAAIGVGMALIAGLAWMLRETIDELGGHGARGVEPRLVRVPPPTSAQKAA